jgi:hypothetical protein
VDNAVLDAIRADLERASEALADANATVVASTGECRLCGRDTRADAHRQDCLARALGRVKMTVEGIMVRMRPRGR